MAVKRAPDRRVSRAEARATTRARVLDAAERAFAAEGFGGTSLDRIAAAAGLTRGAIYSNFEDKADLFGAVLDRRLERQTAEITAAIGEAGDAAGFLDLLRSTSSDHEAASGVRWAMLYDEYRLFALRNPSARRRLAAHERLERERYATAVRHFTAEVGATLPIDERLAAAILFALDRGLYRQHLVDPHGVPQHAFADAVEFLLRAAAALAARVD